MKWLAVALLCAGFLLVLIGFGSDPFIVPFQDFDQMPKEQAQAYVQASHRSGTMERIGACIGAGGFILLVLMLVMRRRPPADGPVRIADRE